MMIVVLLVACVWWQKMYKHRSYENKIMLKFCISIGLSYSVFYKIC